MNIEHGMFQVKKVWIPRSLHSYHMAMAQREEPSASLPQAAPFNMINVILTNCSFIMMLYFQLQVVLKAFAIGTSASAAVFIAEYFGKSKILQTIFRKAQNILP